jgi:hypothetical protein
MQMGDALAGDFCGAGKGGTLSGSRQESGGGLLLIAVHGVAVVLKRESVMRSVQLNVGEKGG